MAATHSSARKVAAQQEMAQAYETKAASLLEKLRVVCEQIGKEKGYDRILEVSQGGGVFRKIR